MANESQEVAKENLFTLPTIELLEPEPPTIECSSNTDMQLLKYKYSWTITNFHLCTKDIGEYVSSPDFPEGPDQNLKWSIKLYPGGKEKDCTDFVSLFMNIVMCDDSAVHATTKFSLLNSKQEVIVRTVGAFHRFVKGSGWGYKTFYRYNKLQSRLPDNKLIIVCEIGANGVAIHKSTSLKPFSSESLSAVFENKDFGDVTFIVEGKVLKAHKVILSSESALFHSMFKQDMKIDQIISIQVADVKYEVVKEMLYFLYTGKSKNLKNLAKDLLALAEKYLLKKLKALCEEELCHKITIENAAEMFILADSYNSTEIKSKAINYINTHVKEVTITAGWMSMIRTHSHLVTEVLWALAKEKPADLVPFSSKRSKLN